MNRPFSHTLGHGITCIDAEYHRPRLACCYLLQQDDEIAIIETGTKFTVPLIEQVMQEQGLKWEQVRYIIPTHVHLDHAGGAGELMRLCSNATLIAHPYGSRHLINPEKLIAGTIAVYGKENYQRLYGEILPIDAARVVEIGERTTLDLSGRSLICIDTPGHARHHLCIWDEESRGIFSGDTFGISYSELMLSDGPFMLLPSTPVQFDPAAWATTLDMLMTLEPRQIYLTHFCQLEDPQDHIGQLHSLIHAYREIALKAREGTDREESIHQSLRQLYLYRYQQRNGSLSAEQLFDLIEMDLRLCSQGLESWLQRQEQ